MVFRGPWQKRLVWVEYLEGMQDGADRTMMLECASLLFSWQPLSAKQLSKQSQLQESKHARDPSVNFI